MNEWTLYCVIVINTNIKYRHLRALSLLSSASPIVAFFGMTEAFLWPMARLCIARVAYWFLRLFLSLASSQNRVCHPSAPRWEHSKIHRPCLSRAHHLWLLKSMQSEFISLWMGKWNYKPSKRKTHRQTAWVHMHRTAWSRLLSILCQPCVALRS